MWRKKKFPRTPSRLGRGDYFFLPVHFLSYILSQLENGWISVCTVAVHIPYLDDPRRFFSVNHLCFRRKYANGIDERRAFSKRTTARNVESEDFRSGNPRIGWNRDRSTGLESNEVRRPVRTLHLYYEVSMIPSTLTHGTSDA